MAQALNVGDGVELKTGGAKMTVVSIQDQGGDVRCVWFGKDGKPENGVFPQAALRAKGKK